MADRPDLSVADGDAGLRVTGLRKSYRKKPVILDFSMELNRGEVVALLGPNGSGKTTTFYSIAGLVTPEAGQVMIDGRDVTLLPMYRRAKFGIGYLPQEMSVFRGLNVEDNILAILEVAERDRHKRRERLEELLSEFSIGHLRRAPAWPCRAANGAGLKSPAAWPRIPNTCCWMSPLRASIRLPSGGKSEPWSMTSKIVVSAC